MNYPLEIVYEIQGLSFKYLESLKVVELYPLIREISWMLWILLFSGIYLIIDIGI